MKEGDTAIINSEDSFADFFAAQARKQGLVTRRVGFAADNDVVVDGYAQQPACLGNALRDLDERSAGLYPPC